MSNKNIWDEVYSSDKNMPWTKNPVPINILNNFVGYFDKDSRVLDYGGGDGILSKFLMEHGLSVTCSDISEKALFFAKNNIPNLKTVQVNNPKYFLKGDLFHGILVWGVMHHVDKDEWDNYLNTFYSLLNKNGVLLIGGHSSKNFDFENGTRFSPTTGNISHSLEYLDDSISKTDFKILDEGHFNFVEAFSGNQRVFKYYLLQR